MIIQNGNTLELATEKVMYTQNGKELENIIAEEGKAWWTALESSEKISNVSFEQISYEQDVLDRFEEVKELNTKNIGALQEYVETGVVSESLNNTTSYFLKKENELLEGTVMELTAIIASLIV